MALIGDTSNLDVLKYNGENLLPLMNSYTLVTQDGTVTSNVSAGMTKMQLQFQNSPYRVACVYRTFSMFEAQWLHGFFNDHRGMKFIAYLCIEQVEPQPYIVLIPEGTVNSTFNMAGGDIPVEFEVLPVIDRCFQQSIQSIAPCMGNPFAVANFLNQAVNSKPQG